MLKIIKAYEAKLKLEIILLILNSLLLGIWAVKETIALRNILLVLGTILVVHYIRREYKSGLLKVDLNFWKNLPLVTIFLTFIWVIVHFFFFSIDPESQLQELKSTWLRAFFATIVGFGCGLILIRYPNRFYILWMGIFFSFLFLFYQYIPRAIAQQKLLVPDYSNYLFHLKINTVLMGSILIAGTSGNLFDYLSSIKYRINSQKIWYFFYWSIINLIVLWSFVFIVDSRGGIGLFIALIFFWIACALILAVKRRHSFFIKIHTKFFLVGLILFLLVAFFVVAQMKLNTGWKSLYDDLIIAVQIDKYQNWKNLERPYPINSSGQTVNASNYERIALATAGANAILHYPIGVGLLANPFSLLPNAPEKMLVGHKVATHSGWIELGLAFGMPILALVFVALITTFAIVARADYVNKMVILNLIVLITFLYTVGEAAIDHGLELLFYFLALTSSVPFFMSKNKRSEQTYPA